jgi:hypothetical protein
MQAHKITQTEPTSKNLDNILCCSVISSLLELDQVVWTLLKANGRTDITKIACSSEYLFRNATKTQEESLTGFGFVMAAVPDLLLANRQKEN